MFRSFRIGSIGGIPIKLDVTFLLILPIFAYIIALQIEDLVGLLNTTFAIAIDTGAMTTGWMPWMLGSIAALGLFACVLFHELGHSGAALRYGFPISAITLWLLGGIAQLSEQPTDWREELTIAIAGPFVSVALGIGLWLAMYPIPSGMDALLFVVGYLSLMNLVLAGFNMLPGFPMDGGRVLRAMLARNRSFAVATQQAVNVGKAFAVALAVFGLFATNFILIAVALFIYLAAGSEARNAALRHAFEGIRVEDAMTPLADLSRIGPEMRVDDLAQQMYADRSTGYPVIADTGVIGIVVLDDIRDCHPGERQTTQVRDVMRRDLAVVEVGDDAFRAIEALQGADTDRVLVTDEADRVVGMISNSDLAHAVEIRSVESIGDRRQLRDMATKDRYPRW